MGRRLLLSRRDHWRRTPRDGSRHGLFDVSRSQLRRQSDSRLLGLLVAVTRRDRQPDESLAFVFGDARTSFVPPTQTRLRRDVALIGRHAAPLRRFFLV